MDEFFMQEALKEAAKAMERKEVPIGAVVVKDGVVIARGYNLRETAKDPTAHAEILAIREASQVLGGWRLHGCDLYVTIEPCPMCAGAIMMARIDRLIIGAMDPKAGAAGSLLNIPEDERFNHQTEIIQGVLEEECAGIMKAFFKELRKSK
ncbi:tRNA(adenine34) deaminase [Geosporobacter subterraneus DSM 17957]|uniref:tRNA-specific adenosine deaminase n=2 Tax=Geosporobacter TaxID=390805 RepID=A0A1M6KK97_9FIRM|nr:tRNA adenosine(34) deaminase TadA [Geosporobacter subterraneus]SHJ59346.1 tRNA(adenine34) deaminase [Geosporobacter subterraneus DSM 17957]